MKSSEKEQFVRDVMAFTNQRLDPENEKDVALYKVIHAAVAQWWLPHDEIKELWTVVEVIDKSLGNRIDNIEASRN